MSDDMEGREVQPPDMDENARAETTGDAETDGGENGDVALARSGRDEGLRELLAENFLEYASYVIKDRAIPDLNDGLKPVQRRILHSLYELDDGRFHKVANIIGHTMRYHPHGDASIGNALVVLANKEYFIDRQGNFGNIYTGDQASAARYIECRLTPLAREVLFNPEITDFVDSYDGRNREPVTLPAKVPALLMLGAEGIAVGMSTRILPHNFIELLEAQIAILRNKPFQVFPDFPTEGIMDVADYDDGRGRIKVRARIEVVNDKTLVVRELPAGTTTESLTNSIENAARKGKLKIVSIRDYTAEKPEIEIRLARGEHAADAIKRLYAYTDCEVGISSHLLVIRDQRPVEMTVSEVLRYNTEKLVHDLERELRILLHKLRERFHEKTLAQIFIENRIYKRIEECETWTDVLQEVRSGLETFRHMLRRDITDEDIEKLLQLQIRRISRFDINKNRKDIDDIVRNIEETEDNLAHLTRFTIRYLKSLLKKYGAQYPRRTQIADLETINIKEVALENLRVGHDRVNRFIGTEVRNSNKNEPYLACSEFDHLILLRGNGRFRIVPVTEKLYVGPVKFLLKADKRQVYSMLYRDRKTGAYYAKRFRFDRYILNREYATVPPGCIVEGLYTNAGVVVRCELEPNPRRKQQYVDVDFDKLPIRSTGARGFKVTGHKVVTTVQLRRGTPAAPVSGERAPAETETAEAGAAAANGTVPQPQSEAAPAGTTGGPAASAPKKDGAPETDVSADTTPPPDGGSAQADAGAPEQPAAPASVPPDRAGPAAPSAPEKDDAPTDAGAESAPRPAPRAGRPDAGDPEVGGSDIVPGKTGRKKVRTKSGRAKSARPARRKPPKPAAPVTTAPAPVAAEAKAAKEKPPKPKKSARKLAEEWERRSAEARKLPARSKKGAATPDAADTTPAPPPENPMSSAPESEPKDAGAASKTETPKRKSAHSRKRAGGRTPKTDAGTVKTDPREVPAAKKPVSRSPAAKRARRKTPKSTAGAATPEGPASDHATSAEPKVAASTAPVNKPSATSKTPRPRKRAGSTKKKTAPPAEVQSKEKKATTSAGRRAQPTKPRPAAAAPPKKPAGPAESKRKETPTPPAPAKPAAPTRPKLSKRIDEETPFRLE